MEILVDSHERYAYRFANQQVHTERRALPAGDYGVEHGGHLVGVVERKSLPDLVGSLTGGKLKYAIGELAALPRAALVVEDRYSAVFKLDRVRPAVVADGLPGRRLLRRTGHERHRPSSCQPGHLTLRLNPSPALGSLPRAGAGR